MCGIFAMLCTDCQIAENFYKKHIEELLKNRGPDDSSTLCQDKVFFGSSVLWHQGKTLTRQPIIIDSKKILLFNGDLFMDEISKDESDAEYLVGLLKTAENDSDLIGIFKELTGPFSIIFYFNGNLYFIRDSLGRNSLILGKSQDNIFLTSVVDDKNEDIQALEVPPLGLYKINIQNENFELFPFQEIVHEHHLEQLDAIRRVINVILREEIIQPKWIMYKQHSIDFSFDKLDLEKIDTDDIFTHLLSIPVVNDLCEKFIKLLENSLKHRISKTQKECKNCLLNNAGNCNHCNVAVLFSGGVDCTLLTALAHKFIDYEKPIDLLNVAFEKVSNKSVKIDFNVPDRITGLETLEELKQLYHERKWNFVEINITRSKLYSHRDKLRSLVYPLSNVLDESLGIAVYFASTGCGILDEKSYESPCRVILMGSGADELFGGYSRHRNAFKRGTPENDLLTKELDLDWTRLPSRNLARDDRVVADNQITKRLPFVEENFVNFARSLKPLQRCYHALPEGIGDKLLLRLCAFKIGLENCCRFRKRALQFGSRIADKKQCAADKSKLLERNIE